IAQWPGYLGIIAGARKDLKGQGRRVLLTSLVAAVGSAVGCALLLVLPSAVFDAVVPVLVLLASAVFALQPLIRRWVAPTPGAPACCPPCARPRCTPATSAARSASSSSPRSRSSPTTRSCGSTPSRGSCRWWSRP